MQKSGAEWHIVPQLYDAAIKTRSANPSRAAFMPVIGDLIAEWDKLCESGYFEEQAKVNDGWSEPDYQMPALPQGGDGAGRRAAIALMARGEAVVCKCDPANGLQWPAELTADSLFWVCRQHPKCGFRWSVADTANAPRPSKPKSNILGDWMPKDAMPPAQKYPPEIQSAADTLSYDLDGMDATLYNTFRGFVEWFHSRYECALSQSVMADAWPKFASESLSAA